MKENESVAVGWDQRGLVYRYELGLEELAPASGGEDHSYSKLNKINCQLYVDALVGFKKIVKERKFIIRKM